MPLEGLHRDIVKALAETAVKSNDRQVATSTAKLASEGNGNARLVVDELRKRGVTINPPAAPKSQ